MLIGVAAGDNYDRSRHCDAGDNAADDVDVVAAVGRQGAFKQACSSCHCMRCLCCGGW